MAQPFNLGNSFLGKSTIELVNPANTAVSTTISVDSDGDLFFQRYVDDLPKGNLKFPVHSYGQSEKKDMHTDANGDVRFANTWTEAITVTTTVSDTNADAGGGPITGVEYLVVGGGGGGGIGSGAGGGGAGGLLHAFDSSIDTAFISIGNGAKSVHTTTFLPGYNGESTIFGDLISYGGGGGGSEQDDISVASGQVGGSGGGSAYQRQPGTIGGVAIDGGSQGNSGATSGGLYHGGGGGGSAEPGESTSSRGGNGGNGTPISITGTEIYYAAGGGGGAQAGGSGATPGNGGNGGGGQGISYLASRTSAMDATGFGSGGGGGQTPKSTPGGSGSDGIVVLAYPESENTLAYIDGNLAYKYSAPTDDAPKRSGYHVYEFVGGAGQISATETDPAFYSKELQNACLFDGNSDELVKSGMTGASDWTMSLWFKLSATSEEMRIIRMGWSPAFYITVTGEGKIQITGTTPSSLDVMSTALFRDTSAWYHLVANKTGVFINGERIITLSSNLSTVGDGSTGNNGKWHIGQNGANKTLYFNGYMADIYYIEGQVLDPNSFGTYREGVWIPKQYGSGDSANAQTEYGTNGFHLDFSDADDLGKDVSGKNNHWT